MEGKGSFFILLFIVAFLSLTIAVLAGYVFFVAGNPKTPTEAVKQEDAKKPKEEELHTVQLFEGKKYLNLKNTDDKKIAVIQIGISIKYFKGKEKEEKKIEDKIKPYIEELQEKTIEYFGDITLEEALNKSATMDKAKKDLLKKFNEIVPPDEKEKKSIIYSVIFYDWFAQ